MKKLIAIFSCLALASIAFAEQNQHKKGKKGNEPQQTQSPAGGNVTGGTGHKGKKGVHNTGALQNVSGQNTPTGKHHHKGAGKSEFDEMTVKKHTGKNSHVGDGQMNKTGKGLHAKKFEKKQFKLADKPKSDIPNAEFKEGKHIKGSEHWKGDKYVVFKNYKCEWHDHDWWDHHHHNIVFVFGGPYYWDSGYWFPAWGYAPNAFFAYEGPIYTGSASTDPGQIVANVQSALQQEGFYTGEVDGVLGPLTRAALAEYQQAQGFEPTGAIDEPTLESLGMV